MENENIVYGRLTESVHISGYSLERAIGEFEWLLEEDRWKKVGTGYDDINEFLKTLSFKEFKIAIDQRKKIAEKLVELQASQRATAKVLNVSKSTVQSDTGQKRPPEEIPDIEYQEVMKDTGQKRPPEEIPEWIEESGQKEVVQQKRKEENQEKKIKERELQSEEGSKIIITKKDFDIRYGNFVEVLENIPDNSIDLILTDPPYPHEFIECWSDLSLFAGRKLKENGFCIAYSGQTNLIEVMNRMSENLEYYWTFALFQSGGNQLITHRNIFCGWKPLLVFQNGKKKQDSPCDDVIKGSGMEKSLHEWQQAELELKPIIEHFTKPGELICDPFLGSATTGIAAYSFNRKFIGAEIEENTFNIAKKRFNDYSRK